MKSTKYELFNNHVTLERHTVQPDLLSELLPFLSATELEKSLRFKLADDRVRYQFAHGMLRKQLGAHLKADPKQLEFTTNPHGKPALLNQSTRFNLSHSGDQVLIGISNDYEIGVDIECIRPLKDPLALAKRFFTLEEFESIQASEPHLQTRQFFKIWTQKEAIVKAQGRSIANTFLSFSIYHPETYLSCKVESILEPSWCLAFAIIK